MSQDKTDKQLKFVELFFEPEYSGKVRQAATDAGYSPNTPLSIIIGSVRDELMVMADKVLLVNLPESIHGIVNVLRDPEQKGARARLDAAAMLMDRVGVTKKERIEIEHKAPNGLFIIPSKKD